MSSSDYRAAYDIASAAVRTHYFDPLNAFTDAAKAWVADAERRATAAEATLEALRPVWAQGFTDDSQAAQANGNALAELWQLLHATDQTQAIENLHRLIAAAAESDRHRDDASRLRFPDTTGQ